MGKLRTGSKSDLVGCLEDLVPLQENASNPTVQVINIDGAGLVNMLRPAAAKKFSDYAQQVFSPYILSEWMSCGMNIFLRTETRSKRGKGVRTKTR